MRSAWLAPLLLLVPLTAAGCSEGEQSIDTAGNAGRSPGNDRDSGTIVRRDAGGRAGSGGMGFRDAGWPDGGDDAGMDSGPPGDPRAPVIEVLEPAAAMDPNTDEILTTTSVRVRCRVTKSEVMDARDVDQSSVEIRMLTPDQAASQPVASPVNAVANNEFEAEFQLAAIPNGRLRFECSAADTGLPALTATRAVETFLDLGPRITLLDPVDGSSHALKEPVFVRFEVAAAPVSADDEEATPTDIRLLVIDQEFAVTEDPQQQGLYTASVDFEDGTLFPLAPTSAEIVVTAASSRTSIAPTREVRADIELDAVGPTITVNAPSAFSVVRHVVELSVNVTDPSGVQPGTVIATIPLNSGTHVISDWDQTNNRYVDSFDTRTQAFADLTQITIQIEAQDTVGNKTTIGHIIKLDNVPPVISLDPPVIREYVRDAAPPYPCSHYFDPVGEAMNDGGLALDASLYRALVFERTGSSKGQNYLYAGGVAAGTVKLYAQGEPSVPLLVDDNGDGQCDEINFESTPAPIVVTLAPLTVRGNAGNIAATDFDAPEHLAPSFCEAGTATMLPNPLCPATVMWRAIAQPLDSKPPAIYAINPTNTSSGACAGETWLLLPLVGEGWGCLAARVEDNVGNVGVSPPLRVCFDDGEGPAPACNDGDPLTDPMPTCMASCTPPDDLPPHSMTIR